MLSPSLTLNDLTFDKIVQGYANSRYSVQDVALTEPTSVDIKHETTKSGQVNTALISKVRKRNVAGDPFEETRVTLKLTYKPFGNRTDVQASLLSQIATLNDLVINEFDSLMNKES